MQDKDMELQPMEADEEYSPTIITLTDENGESFMFEVVDEIEHNEEHYLAVVEHFDDPQKALEAEPVLIIFRVGDADEDGLETFDIVDDDEEFFEVGGIFETRLREFYEFEE